MTRQHDINTLINLINAYRSLAQAESDYFRSVTNYARSIAGVHFRKGSLLEYNGVYLTEGPWPAKAYFDARRRARSRVGRLANGLRLHLSQGLQPRAESAILRPGHGRRRNAGRGTGFGPGHAGEAAVGHRSGDTAGAAAAAAGRTAGDPPARIPRRR